MYFSNNHPSPCCRFGKKKELLPLGGQFFRWNEFREIISREGAMAMNPI
jgi:hypothetical protein